MLAPSNVKLEDKPVRQTEAAEDAADNSDADCSESGNESESDDDTAAAPQQPGTPRHPRPDMPEASLALQTLAPSSSTAMPVSSSGMPLIGSPTSLKAVHSAAPVTCQGFVALSDINTASCQANSHSISSSPSSALGGDSSNFDQNTSSAVTEQKGKRKADQLDLDSIMDPAEKKKQRRLAKNRATAALSRYVPIHLVV